MSEPTADMSSTADGMKLPDTYAPPDAINLNVSGKELAGPDRGFGQLWHKTYRIRLIGSPATPREVIGRWKANFSTYWPKGSNFCRAASKPPLRTVPIGRGVTSSKRVWLGISGAVGSR